MLQMGFELTVPVFERAKTVHALDHGATAITKLHGVTVQKTVLFIMTAVRTTNPRRKKNLMFFFFRGLFDDFISV
jgi:hypothetical protein